jgi:hypothetical protein
MISIPMLLYFDFLGLVVTILFGELVTCIFVIYKARNFFDFKNLAKLITHYLLPFLISILGLYFFKVNSSKLIYIASLLLIIDIAYCLLKFKREVNIYMK